VAANRGSSFVLCKRCHQRRPKVGSSVRFILGLRRRVCSRCAHRRVLQGQGVA
jgi:hypothetical protein